MAPPVAVNGWLLLFVVTVIEEGEQATAPFSVASPSTEYSVGPGVGGRNVMDALNATTLAPCAGTIRL